jgi:cytochrome c oxidase subunit 2
MSAAAVFALVLGLMGAAPESVAPAEPRPEEAVVQVIARRFVYRPSKVPLKVEVPVVLELVSEDRLHGFYVPELGLRAHVEPGHAQRLRFTPHKTGRFPFACDVLCGSGHEDMTGEIVVTE